MTLRQRIDLGRRNVSLTTAALAASLVNSCRKLYGLGARSFLVMNLPPFETSPKYNLPHEVGFESQDQIQESVKTYNNALAREVELWKKEVDADTTIMHFDLESFWKLVLAYPEVFGMTDCARYQMWIDEKRPSLGRMGFWWIPSLSPILTNTLMMSRSSYHDNQHISWSSAESANFLSSVLERS